MTSSENQTVKKIASFVSSVGHPIILAIATTVLVNFTHFSRKRAWELTILMFLFCIVPVVGFLLYKIKKGDYKDLDVSDQHKRKTVYVLVLFVVAALCVYLFVNNYAVLIRSGALAALFMLVAGYLINFKIKVSMHTTFSFMLGAMLWYIDFKYAVFMLIFASFIGISRVILSRHKPVEVALGLALGITSGIVFHLLIYTLS